MRKDWSDKEIAELRRMLRAGKTHAEIARELNRTASSVKGKAISRSVYDDQPKIIRRQSA